MVAIERQQPAITVRSARRGAREVFVKSDLPEALPLALISAKGAVYEHLDLSLGDQVEARARLSLRDDLFPGSRHDGDQVMAQTFEGVDRERREDRVFPKQPEVVFLNGSADLD